MVSYFKYVLSEDEIERILNKEDILIKRGFLTKSGTFVEIEINCYGFSYKTDKMKVPKRETLCKDLLIKPVLRGIIENDTGERETIDISLDVLTNRTYKEYYHTERYKRITEESDYIADEIIIDSKYLLDLIAHTDFTNNDEFFDLCFLYIVYRVVGKQIDGMFELFTKKLEYYGYEEYDLDREIPFNNCKDENFFQLTSLAMTILYKHNDKRDESIDLSSFMLLDDDYDIKPVDLKKYYMNYFLK